MARIHAKYPALTRWANVWRTYGVTKEQAPEEGLVRFGNIPPVPELPRIPPEFPLSDDKVVAKMGNPTVCWSFDWIFC